MRLQITKGETFAYTITEGTNEIQFGCEVVENGVYRDPTVEETIVWSLETPVTGISINSSTGLLTIDNTVVNGSSTKVVATMGSLVDKCPFSVFDYVEPTPPPDFSSDIQALQQENLVLQQAIIELTIVLGSMVGE